MSALVALLLLQTTPPHLKEARDLVAAIKPEQTSYRHKDSVVTWEKPECRTDCSGFWNAIIPRAYPNVTTERLEGWLGTKRPKAEHYYAAMKDGKGFRLRKTVTEIQPGDFIAIKYEKGADNTGHTMLAEDAPKPIANEPGEYSLKVIDVTSSPHGPGDSRGKSAGLGTGTIRLDANSDGTFAGHAWSLSKSAKFRPISLRPILVGEIDLSTIPKIETYRRSFDSRRSISR